MITDILTYVVSQKLMCCCRSIVQRFDVNETPSILVLFTKVDLFEEFLYRFMFLQLIKNTFYFKMTHLISHIDKCLTLTDELRSNLVKEVLDMDGMSGKKTRHFYNNICSMQDARYLEIGTWKGSSFCAAMCNNNMTCVGIDNWSEFGGPKHEFLQNFNKFKGDNNAIFIEKNCWDIDVLKLGKFNIYMYDGDHEENSHFKALDHYLQCLDNEFIYLVDDWNHPPVRSGTNNAIKENNCTILYEKSIRTTDDDSHARISGKISDWHNGICIFVLRKS